MLFSDEAVAEYINANFEPAWESVHPVPVVTIDFGNGHRIERTIGGNVATYVCTSEGQVLDILPGAYLPDVYVERLGQFLLLNAWLRSQRGVGWVANEYHRAQVESLTTAASRANIVAEVSPIASITGTEGRLRFTLAVPGEARHELGERLRRHEESGRLPLPPDIDSAAALAAWPILAEETELNETVRRKLIHEHLAETGLVPPEELTHWLFREVLETDLEDPYLGMGDLLLEAAARGDEPSSGRAPETEPAATGNAPITPFSER